ncbi:TPA: hypothetical protein ACYLN4_008312 [Burkholderia lata]|uniref:hypothetical protein n=1 Tax=Burkholderia cepacia complex TaxID=87882 RepID=UPI0013DD9B85|nr:MULTISPECIES: hypothetical protein [Burkholderia cepacia complex]
MSLTPHGTFHIAALPVDGEFDVQCDTRDGWPPPLASPATASSTVIDAAGE